MKKELEAIILQINGAKSVQVVDVNNDGQMEWVLKWMDGGSMGAININIYIKASDGTFKNIGDIPEPDRQGYDGPWYFFGGTITQVCGKNYITFEERFDEKIDFARNTFIWEKNKTVHACDLAWIKYEQEKFMENYKKKDFYQAYADMATLFKNCQTDLSVERSISIQNDLAVTAYHKGEAQKCLEHVTFAKFLIDKNPVEKKKLSATLHNEKLCSEALRIQQEIETKSFDEICKLDFTKIPARAQNFIRMISSTTQSKTCLEAAEKIHRTRSLKLELCGFMDLQDEDLTWIRSFNKLDELEIYENASRPCRYIGVSDVKDWKLLSSLNLRRIKTNGMTFVSGLVAFIEQQKTIQELEMNSGYGAQLSPDLVSRILKITHLRSFKMEGKERKL